MKFNIYIFGIAALLCSCVAAPGAQQARHQKALHTPDRLSTSVSRTASHTNTRLIPTGTHNNSAQARKPAQARERTIKTFIITGNSRIPTAKIQSRLQPYIGAHKTNTDVSNAMRSVIDLYSASGLNGAIVTKADGIVVLNVIESGINAGAGTGPESAGRHYSLSIRATPALDETTPPAPNRRATDAAPALPNRHQHHASAFFIVKGNTRVSTADIQHVIEPFAARHFVPDAFFMARQAVMDLYESRGLHGVSIGIPPHFDTRPVLLHVYEDDINSTMANTAADHRAAGAAPANWVLRGWRQIRRNHIHQALVIWQQGVNDMPADRLLAYLGVYNQRSAALRRLKRIGLKQSAIILKASSKGKTAYYVMSARDIPIDKAQRNQQLAGLRMLMGQHRSIRASSARKFQTRVRH